MEVWKDIFGFECYYSISSFGNVKSKARYRKGIKGAPTKVNQRILKPSVDKYGYMRCVLSKNGLKYYRSVHRLVAKAFITKKENKPQVNHKNGIKNDNNISNLEWCNDIENKIHCRQTIFKNYDNFFKKTLSLGALAKG